MRAYVNRKCIGCGLCATLCGDLFSMEGQDMAKAIPENVPPSAEAMVIEAKSNCPAVAIETRGH